MATRSLLYSNDGITWTSAASPFDSNPGVSPAQGWAVRWGDFVNPSSVHIQAFIAYVSNSATTGRLCTSTDGITWSASNPTGTQSQQWPLGAVSDGSTIPSGSGGFYFTSFGPGVAGNDGVTFPISVADPTGGVSAINNDFEITFGNGTWVVGDGNTDIAYTSANLGGAWTSHSINGGTASEVGPILYDGSTQFVCGLQGQFATPVMLTSPTGATWTNRQNGSTPVSNPFGLAFASSIPRWVVIGSNLTDHTGTGGFFIMTSPDGITWTGHANPFPSQPFAIVWSSAHSLFAVVGQSTWVSRSSDGLTWTNATLPFSATTAYDIAVSPSLSRFVIACTLTSPVLPAAAWLLG